MQLKTKPIVLSLIVIFGLTLVAFLLTSTLRYTSPGAVIGYLKTHSQDVAIACIDPGNSQNGFTQNADEAYPLAGVFKLVLLSAYADQVAAGQLNAQEIIPLTELEKYYLPGTDGGAHPEFLKSLGADRTTLTLDETVDGMTEYGSNAAADYLAARLKQVDFLALYKRLGLKHTSQPSSFLGLYLFIKNHETGMYAEEDLTAQQQRAEQIRLADLFINDADWRQTEVSFITKPTNAAPQNIQQQVINAYGVQGSALDMAQILLTAYGYNNALSPEAQTIVRKHLEWPAKLHPENTKPFKTLASASGVWPDILTSAWYAQGQNSAPRVLVVLYRNVPDDYWSTWINTFSHEQLETQVLLDKDCSLFADK